MSWADDMDRAMEQNPEMFGMVIDDHGNPVPAVTEPDLRAALEQALTDWDCEDRSGDKRLTPYEQGYERGRREAVGGIRRATLAAPAVTEPDPVTVGLRRINERYGYAAPAVTEPNVQDVTPQVTGALGWVVEARSRVNRGARASEVHDALDHAAESLRRALELDL